MVSLFLPGTFGGFLFFDSHHAKKEFAVGAKDLSLALKTAASQKKLTAQVKFRHDHSQAVVFCEQQFEHSASEPLAPKARFDRKLLQVRRGAGA